MEPIENKENLLRKLPGVDRILELSKENGRYDDVPKSVLVNATRFVIEELRARIIKNEAALSIKTQDILDRIRQKVEKEMQPNLRRMVNGTGVVVHTNLGRSLLAKEAVEGIHEVAASYSNLEFDISKGCIASIDEPLKNNKNWLVYPNPFRDIVNISGINADETISYRIYNASGILLIEKTDKLEKAKSRLVFTNFS